MTFECSPVLPAEHAYTEQGIGRTGRECAQCGKAVSRRTRPLTGRWHQGRRVWCCSRECATAYGRALRSKDCKGCGVRFVPSAGQTYCSQPCVDGAKARPTRQCAVCERTYKPKAVDRTTCCSRECGLVYVQQVRRERFAAVRDALPPPQTEVWCRDCGHCGAAFVTRAEQQPYCSWCRRYRPKCCICSVAYRGGSRSRWERTCSAECQAANEARKAANAKRSKRAAQSRRRAKIRGLRHESVDPIAVFERDGWRCQICSCRTPARLRGTRKADAPELDHRVPLAKGGTHTLDNLQTACRACNQEKSDRLVIGQLPLWTEAPTGRGGSERYSLETGYKSEAKRS